MQVNTKQIFSERGTKLIFLKLAPYYFLAALHMSILARRFPLLLPSVLA